MWSDEFAEEGPPDPEKWSHEVGYVRNQEGQYYTEGRRKNARVEDGVLIIEAHKEPFENAAHELGHPDWRKGWGTARYTSASLHTKNSSTWTYGRMEVRAKLPQGKGTWPAIWTLGANIDAVDRPRCGEIDIMEFVGKEPDVIHATTHFAKDGQHDSDTKSRAVHEPWKDYHIYSIEWDADHIHFAFDGVRYQTFRIQKADGAETNAFRLPHYLILNLAIGGNWGGAIDDAIFPCQFRIDYVRVYQRVSQKS